MQKLTKLHYASNHLWIPCIIQENKEIVTAEENTVLQFETIKILPKSHELKTKISVQPFDMESNPS